ncbi:DUF6522 family protein [Aminobacter sp. AP02]|jgi:hypothetical protein|uniref:DUF6522 family protein n=1 Tax=Aminobacter sp. AP02 TaxID=2135737 RepID=UPI0011B27CF3|nr:DUF6522 family protein [Aminobacter sp. AP02]
MYVYVAQRRRDEGNRMKLEPDQSGDYVLEPRFLAQRLSIEEHELQRRMRLGLVTSRVECGIDGDKGLKRLTVRNRNSVWRAIVDADNRIVSEESFELEQAAAAAN